MLCFCVNQWILLELPLEIWLCTFRTLNNLRTTASAKPTPIWLPSHACWNPEYQWHTTQQIREYLFQVAQFFWVPSQCHSWPFPLSHCLTCLSHVKLLRVVGDCLPEVLTVYLFLVKEEPNKPGQFQRLPKSIILLNLWLWASLPAPPPRLDV